MNIFVLDESPITSAEMMCDKHVVKMPVETAQMLSTVHRFLDGKQTHFKSKNGRNLKTWTHLTDSVEYNPNGPVLYRSTMINHPCTVWARQTMGNYDWLVRHGLALCSEYTRRYDKIHGSQKVIEWCRENMPKKISPSIYLTEFAQAMPDQYRVKYDAVSAYRNYYIGEKERFATWTNRDIPEWWPYGVVLT